jgi:hypothetical protein
MSDAQSWTQAEQERVRRTAVNAVLDGMTYEVYYQSRLQQRVA